MEYAAAREGRGVPRQMTLESLRIYYCFLPLREGLGILLGEDVWTGEESKVDTL